MVNLAGLLAERVKVLPERVVTERAGAGSLGKGLEGAIVYVGWKDEKRVFQIMRLSSFATKTFLVASKIFQFVITQHLTCSETFLDHEYPSSA
jgi:hypothetical protein